VTFLLREHRRLCFGRRLDDDQAKQMKVDPDPIVRHMAPSPNDRLESARGSAMDRRQDTVHQQNSGSFCRCVVIFHKFMLAGCR
jgi:hypothetical protein